VIGPFEKPAWKGREASRSKRPYKAWRKGTVKEKNLKERQKMWKEEKRLNKEISGKPGTKILESFYSASWKEMVNELLPEE